METLHQDMLHAVRVIKDGIIARNTVKLFLRKLKMDKDESTFVINYQNIIAEKTFMSLTRFLANEMAKNPFLSVGYFLANISDADLSTLSSIVEGGENHPALSELMLIAEMLASGEGLDRGSLDTIHQRVNMFITFITLESLYRKKLIKLYHKNMSFGDDMKNALVAERLYH
jgi:hypothetical protein